MAQRHIVQLIDDLDGVPIDGDGGSTVKFGLDGKSYEIDLSAVNAEKFQSVMAPYVKAARVTSAARGRGQTRRNAPGDLQAIRSWASANGHSVGDRGRIPTAIREAYEAAH